MRTVVVVYHYTFVSGGGLADFLKYFLHCADLCNRFGIELKVCVDHPLRYYLEWTRPGVHIEVMPDPKDMRLLSSRDYGRHISEILETCTVSYLRLCSLDFFSYGIRYDLSHELNFHTYEENTMLRCDEWFTIINGGDDDIHKSRLSKKPYVCIHMRMGDKHLDTVPSVEYCAEDDRSIALVDMQRHVRNVLDATDREEYDVFFLSDSTDTIRLVQDACGPGLRTLCSSEHVVLNISYPMPGDPDRFEQGLRTTIYEFEFLREADAIYSLSYSGFAIMAHVTRKTLTQELFKLYPVCTTYV